jgi:hypothetical protein
MSPDENCATIVLLPATGAITRLTTLVRALNVKDSAWAVVVIAQSRTTAPKYRLMEMPPSPVVRDRESLRLGAPKGDDVALDLPRRCY